MSRDLGYVQRHAYGARIGAPQLLIFVQLLEPMFLSTRVGVSSMGEYWEPHKLQIEDDEVSQDTAKFRIYNEGYKYTMAAQAGAFLRSPVRIYSAFMWPGDEMPPYFPEGYFPDGYFVVGTGPVPATLLFDGFISEILNVDEWLHVRCRRAPAQLYPKRWIRAPFANHLPSPGRVMEWKGETYRIDN